MWTERQFELADELAEAERVRALEAVRARMRAQQGGSGTCHDCGEPIAPERLAVRPSALRCFDCQSLFEQQQKQVGRP